MIHQLTANMRSLKGLLIGFLTLAVGGMAIAQDQGGSPEPNTFLLRGLLRPHRVVTLRAATGGKVRKIDAPVGANINGGEVLVQIESSELDRQRQELMAAWRYANELGRIASNGHREAELFENALAGSLQKALQIRNRLEGRRLLRSQFEKAISAIEKIEAGLELVRTKKLEITNQCVQAAHAMERVQLANQHATRLMDYATNVRSPMDAVVSRRLVAEGELVVLGQPLLELVQIDPIQIVTWLPAEVKNPEDIMLIEIQLPGSTMRQVAKLELLSPIIDDRTGRRPLVAKVANPEARFIPGLNVHVHVRVRDE